MKNKVIIFSPSEKIWGGGQIYIEQLCKFLNKKNLYTLIATSEPNTFECDTLKIKSVRKKINRLKESIKLAKYMKKNNFNIIILNDLSSLWLAPIFKIYGIRVISLLHLYLEKKKNNPLAHSFLEYYLIKYSANFCDRIFSVNKENIKVFGEKVKFIGNYVPDWFFNVPKVSNKKYDFILVARFAKQKNIPLFIKLLYNLNKFSGKTYTALLVGDGPEKMHILQEIKKYGLENSITIKNWIERKNLPNIFDQGKVFVISSFHEGFATTLLESHSRGLPAIVTRTSGFCGEFVENYNFKTGIVFEFDDVVKEKFLTEVMKLVENFKNYEDKCIQKAKFFTEEKVLGQIFNSCKE